MSVQNQHHNISKLAVTPLPANKLFSSFGSTEPESRTLLAAAAEFFASTKAANSREFLAKSRQTGGE